ncbi:chemotaxis protein CheD [bacterium]|nr:chemotaxis protein CheD [bacterium]
MHVTVSLSNMKLSKNLTDTLVARDVGTGVGLAVHDPISKISGLYYMMLPNSSVYPGMAQKKPLMFANTGIPLFIQAFLEQGANRIHLKACIAGGADLIPTGKIVFSVGRENIRSVSEILHTNGIFIQQHIVGGNRSRAIYLDVGSGQSRVSEN